jgi:hypothetical protein
LTVLLLVAQCKMHYWWLVTWLDLTIGLIRVSLDYKSRSVILVSLIRFDYSMRLEEGDPTSANLSKMGCQSRIFSRRRLGGRKDCKVSIPPMGRIQLSGSQGIYDKDGYAVSTLRCGAKSTYAGLKTRRSFS